jgi:hypothetical protein
MQNLARRFDRLPDGGWDVSQPYFDDPATKLREELAARRTLPKGPILISNSHDEAMSPAVAGDTIEVLRALRDFGLLDRTLLLTKAPERMFDSLKAAGCIGAREGLRFGVSLTSLGIWLTQHFEPGAELPAQRIAGYLGAVNAGYQTWLSIEPPLPEVFAHRLVGHVVDELPGDPWIVVGKLNANGIPGNDELQKMLIEWANADHWAEDRDRSIALLRQADYVESLNVQDRAYWIKKELRSA